MKFYESSAKTSENVKEIYTDLAKVILNKVKNGEIDPENEVSYYCIILLLKSSGVK